MPHTTDECPCLSRSREEAAPFQAWVPRDPCGRVAEGAAAAAAAALAAALWSRPASCAESFYGLLGLKQGASDAEIKKAYKKAALKHHPDKVSCPPPPLLLHNCIRTLP